LQEKNVLTFFHEKNGFKVTCLLRIFFKSNLTEHSFFDVKMMLSILLRPKIDAFDVVGFKKYRTESHLVNSRKL